MIIKENFGYLEGINLIYVGDGCNNIVYLLMVVGVMLGVNVRICIFKLLNLKEVYVDIVKEKVS